MPARVEAELVRAHGFAALAALLIAATFGIVISLQFFLPDLTGGAPVLSWGRVRYAHTQGIMLGWLGNAFLAFLYHAVPVLSGRRITGARLGWWLFGIWNFAVIVPGWTLVLAGVSQPLEWAEFPLVVDVFVVLALALAAVQFLPPFFRRGLEDLYVSSWYIIGALIFTLLAYPMGNVVPEYVAGASGAAISGLWIHDAVGLFVTPLALAILYFVIPAASGRPIYSHFLSMVGFWGLFFLYPLNGTHHYVFSIIPMAAQTGAIAASALLGVDVIIVVSNLLLSLKGTRPWRGDIGLRFAALSTVFYLVVSLQGSLQAQMSINQAVHFTDWVIGHSHLAMLGFATFAAIAGLVHAWQRLPSARYNARAIDWAYGLLGIGVTLMVVDLTIAGVVQARLWQDGAPWLDSIRASRPYWIGRTLTALPVAAGFIALLVGMTTGPRGAGLSLPGADDDAVPVATASRSDLAVRKAYGIAAVAGVACFLMSVALLGLWPRLVLADQITATAPAANLPLTVAEQRGRAIYAREGCAYCHTQQIRYLPQDIDRFGAPTAAWEARLDLPHLWGTRRIGPDLSRASATRSADWHFAHLFSPRAVVPLSIMPAYPALFDGAPDRPTVEGRDLVAYLETLGRARELAWPEGDEAALAATSNNAFARMAFDTPLLNAHPARTRPRGAVPAFLEPAPPERAEVLWTDHCASCHGDSGRGDGPAAGWLQPRPTDLTQRMYRDERLRDVLWNGVAGTSMPAWRDQSTSDLAALASHVRLLAAEDPTPPPPTGQLDRGAGIFAANCTQCHGDDGRGDGFAARALPVAPTDFTVQRPSLDVAVDALRNGITGTSMAPWADRLGDDDVLAVAHYVRSLYRPGTSGGEDR